MNSKNKIKKARPERSRGARPESHRRIVVAMSPKQSPRDATGQAGGVLKKVKIVIAMSGGIDSSVSAALLKRAGFDVIGVFMRFWLAPRSLGEGGSGYNRCCSSEAERRARLVAKKLGIRFYVFDFEKEFKKRVVDYFLREYKSGRTPNPCVVCNKEIKFGLLIEKALKIGADYIATGHYARLSTNNEFTTNKRINELRMKNNIRKFGNSQEICYSLMMAKYKEKDQSYFLWKLNQKQLSRVIFPVGELKKSEVKKLAEKFDLPISLDKYKESQEICFVPDNVNTFLKKHLKVKPGKIVDSEGKALGSHQGLALYTIGQRKGIGLSGGPYYVAGKDLKKNRLVATKNKKDLLQNEI